VFGVIMVFSSSSVTSLEEYSSSLFYLKNHVIRVVAGLVLMIGLIMGDYRKIGKFAIFLLIFGFMLLGATYLPGISHGAGGGRRWLNLYFFRIQPSEFFKIFYIIYLARYFSIKSEESDSFMKKLLPQLVILGAAFILIQRQPDLSTSLLVVVIAFLVFFLAYEKLWILFSMMGGGSLVVMYLIYNTPYRFKRMTAFLDPWKNQLNEGYQIIQSLVSVGSGGLFGLGLGESRQKFFYLPEEHTDFIFAIIGEEFGFFGTMLVIVAFWIVLWRGVKIAYNSTDLFGKYLAFGITGALSVQALLNILVVVGLAPPTGVPLPFVSYGGSSLLTNLIGVGILLNISRFKERTGVR
jgi:cell division protein FtsW